MFHYFEAITNTSGDSLIGYFARVVDPATQNTVTISSDDNGTPIVTTSGVENAAVTDAYGNLDFYVVPGTYHLDIYAPNATSLILRVQNVSMNSTKGDPGDPGPKGDTGEGLDDVMAPTGSSLVGFKDAGAGSTARTVGDELSSLPVTPERFGAVGNGTADDTTALQAAFNTGRSIRLTQGKTYLVTSKLTIAASRITVSGGGSIKVGASWNFANDTDGNGTHMRTIFVTGNYVTIDGVTFDATGSPAGTAVENGFLWCTGFSPSVSDCQFIGNPKGTAIWGLAGAAYMSVTSCKFFSCSGAVFAKGRQTIISNNNIFNATDAAIAVNGLSCFGSAIIGNVISNEALAAIPSMIAVEEGASNWTICGNVCTGANGGGIIATNVLDNTPVKGGVISDNIIDGADFNGVLPNNANPAALISIGNVYYDCQIHHNTIRNCPTGNSNSRLAIIPSSGTIFNHNIIDGSATAGLSAMIGITDGTRGILIESNRTKTVTGNGRHFLFSGGDYGSEPCVFRGGDFSGGSENINSELSAGGMTGFVLHISNIQRSTAATVVNGATALGDRAAFLNAGAWAFPHRIGFFTQMYATGIPSVAGAIPYQNGDTFEYLSPTTFKGVVRSAGAWKNYGAIV